VRVSPAEGPGVVVSSGGGDPASSASEQAIEARRETPATVITTRGFRASRQCISNLLVLCDFEPTAPVRPAA
jgi:hypothetical protein